MSADDADVVAPSAERPFDGLDPDVMLGAVESAGMVATGSFIPLNSYENRVYQVMLEDAPAVVAKFYRPARWSDGQILEEHAFSIEMGC